MLLSDSGSNVMLYLSGHGGDGFLKFRDVSNVQSHDLSDALETMRTQQRFKEMLVLVDTCQAATIPEPFLTPRVTSISSSLRGENSYASAYDDFIGQALLDRFTYSALRFIKLNGHTGTVSQLVAALAPDMRSDRYNPQTLDVRATQVRQLLPPKSPLLSHAAAGRNPPAQHEDQRLLLRQSHRHRGRSAALHRVG
jgi:phosphatidylinositol glycan class K